MMPPASNQHLLMTADSVGGVWIYAANLAQQLAKCGWTITLVTLGPAPTREQFLPLLSCPEIDLEITDLELEWQDPAGRDRQRALDYLKSVEDRLRPEIIHANGYREACAGWRAPIVVVAHSCVGSWWRACHGCAANDPAWDSYSTDVAAALNAADRWVAPTATFRDTMERLYAPSRSGEVIWNAVQDLGTPPFSSAEEPFILAAGRMWDEAKNVGILPQIASGLEWPILIAGATRQSENSAPAADGVEWLGNLPHAELRGVMRRAGIFVSPAVYEPFGLTVLEAAGSGCALVLADIPTFRELWDGAALFVDPRNPSELQSALAALSKDTATRRELQQAALQRASRYSLAVHTDAYERLYSQMLGANFRRANVLHPSFVEATA